MGEAGHTEFRFVYNTSDNKYEALTITPNSSNSKGVFYLHNNGDGIVYREADNIYGPYSEPKLLVPYSYPFANGVSSIYGGFVHEKYTEQNGKVFYMTISQWMPVYNSSLVKITLK